MALDRDTARAVITSPVLSAVERSAISLCMQFGDTDPRQALGGSWIITPEELANAPER